MKTIELPITHIEKPNYRFILGNKWRVSLRLGISNEVHFFGDTEEQTIAAAEYYYKKYMDGEF